MPRVLLVVVLLTSALTYAQEECVEDLAQCKDGCLVDFGGSVRVEMKKKYDRCLKKCVKGASRCTERQIGTRTEAEPEPAPTPAEKLRPTVEDSPRPQRTEGQDSLTDGEVPRSSRGTFKTEDEVAKPEPKPEPTAPTPDTSKPATKSKATNKKPADKQRKSGEEEDLRNF